MQRRVKTGSPELSVILAVGDAEETIGRDVRRIAEHLRSLGRAFEIVAVNDGSCDNSLAMLRLLSAETPELRVCAADARGRAFIRGVAEARGAVAVLWQAGRGSCPLSSLGWALARLSAGNSAVIFRGRWIVADRMGALAAILSARGRGDVFEKSFERHARGLDLQIVGTRSRSSGLLGPVRRFLAA